jgi:hypothetical protein
MLLFQQRQGEACDVVLTAFDAAQERQQRQQHPPSSPDHSSGSSLTGTDGPKRILFERRLYPYVLNNWLICQAVKMGTEMTIEHVRYALTLVQEVKQIVVPSGRSGMLHDDSSGKVPVPPYVLESLDIHEASLKEWLDGKREYTGRFVW